MNQRSEDEPKVATTRASKREVPWADVLAMGGAATALITTISALAVTGVLQKVQRNHSSLLATALFLAVFSAALWVITALYRGDRDARLPVWLRWVRRLRFLIRVFPGLAVLSFVIALVVGFIAVIRTQQDTERPDVAAVVTDRATNRIEARVRVSNLSSDARVSIVIYAWWFQNGEQRNWGGPLYVYRALIGPDKDGNVDRAIPYTFGKDTRYEMINVTASVGENEQCEWTDEAEGQPLEGTIKNVKQSDRPACVFLSLRGN